MTNKLYYVMAFCVGVAAGYLSTLSILSNWLVSIIFWLFVGFVVVYLSTNRKAALEGAAIYSFLAITSWLLFSFKGDPSHLPAYSLIIVLASAIAAGIGILGTLLFYKIFRK